VNTGGLVQGWNPNPNAGVRSLAGSANGFRLYVGGRFTTIGGFNRQRLATVDAATGTLDAQWTPSASPVLPGVCAMAAGSSSGRIYAGGDFTRISGRLRQRFARFSEDPNNTSEPCR
jgi:Domain of unknown function (DUF5122) beta-propeller